MSETVIYSGRLEFVLNGKDGIELYVKKVCEERKIEKESYNETYTEQIRDSLEDEFIIIEDCLYRFIEKTREEAGDSIFQANKNTDGTISFLTSFYNGGCDLEEAIEECLKSLELTTKE